LVVEASSCMGSGPFHRRWLGKDATQLHLPGVCRLPVDSATRASSAERTMGTCVPSISMYSTGTGWLRISGNSRCTTPLTWRSTA
jgi:hypothetical protein